MSSDGFLGNVLVLATGAASAKAITLLVSPFLTRLYSPENFGVLALFVAAVTLVSSLSTLRYHVAIPMPKSETLALHLVILSFVLLAAVLSLSALAVLLIGDLLFELLYIEVLVPYRWLIILGVGSTGAYQILYSWALRKKNMRAIAATQLWQSISGSAVKIGAAFVGLIPLGLLLGQLVQQAGGIFRLGRQFLRDISTNTYRLSLVRLVCAVRRYSGFPIYRLPSQFLLVLASQAPLLFVSGLYGTDTAGQYSLAYMVLSVPIALVSQAVGSAYFAEISQMGTARAFEIRRLTIDLMKKLAVVALLPAGLLIALGPELFEIAFGERWRLAGVFAQAMSIFLVFQLVTVPVIHVLTVFQQHARFLWVNVLRVSGVAAAFVLAKWLGLSSVEAITLYSLILALYYCVLVGVVFSLLHSAEVKNG